MKNQNLCISAFVCLSLSLSPMHLFGQAPNSLRTQSTENELPAECRWKANTPQDLNLKLEYHERHLEHCRSVGNTAAISGLLRLIGNYHLRTRNVDRAIEIWGEALAISEELNDTRAVISSMNAIGNAFRFQKNDRGKAVEYFRKSLQLSQQLGDKELASNAWQMIATSEMSPGGNHEQARIASIKALELRREFGGPRDIARALTSTALVHSFTGEADKAIELYEESLKLFDQLSDRNEVARVFQAIGTVYDLRGQSYHAAEYFERSLKVLEGLGPQPQIVEALSGLARHYTRIGAFDKAVQALQKKLSILEEWQKAPTNTIPTPSLPTVSAIRIPIANDPVIELAATYSAIGGVFSSMNKPELAAEFYKRSLAIWEARKDVRGVITHLSYLADQELNQFRYSEAAGYYERMLVVVQSWDDSNRTWAMRPLTRLAYIHAINGNKERATLLAHRAETLSRELKERGTYDPFEGLWWLGRAYVEIGAFEKAIAVLDRSLEVAEQRTERIVGEESRSRMFEMMQDPYKLYIHAAMQLDRNDPTGSYRAKALQMFERSRGRLLLESMNLASDDIERSGDQDLVKKKKELEASLNGLVAQRDRSTGLAVNSSRVSEVEKLRAEIRVLQERIRRSNPRISELMKPTVMSEHEIRSVVDDNTVLLEYSIGLHRSYLWLVSQNTTEGFELSPSREINAAAIQLYEMLRDGGLWTREQQENIQYRNSSQKLSNMLLGPVQDQIKGKRLVIVADGLLQYIPFSSLPMPFGKSPGEANDKFIPLALTNEIVSLPSASVLSVLRKEAANRKQKGKGIAVVADPVFSETDERLAKNGASPKPIYNRADLSRLPLKRAFNFNAEENKPFAVPRLPFTRREAESIFASAPKNISIKALDFDADREKVLKIDLSQYRIVHFATHGILQSEHPELSGIVLSLVNEKGEPVNGFLRLNEIYNMDLNADLVVLSACQTALGKEVRGEGLIGLTRGFMYAGSPRVVASLWKVDDVATAEFMKIFYQKMLKEKMRPAAALRAAKIAMYKTKRWNAPYYWAAFELQGEWR